MSLYNRSRLVAALGGVAIGSPGRVGVAVVAVSSGGDQLGLAHAAATLLGYEVVTLDVSGHAMVVVKEGGEDALRADLAGHAAGGKPIMLLVDAVDYDEADAAHVCVLRVGAEFARTHRSDDRTVAIFAISKDPVGVARSVGHVLDERTWAAFVR